MLRTEVKSTTLKSAGYDATARILELEFCSGRVYRYDEVPASVYRNLLAAKSKGKFFNEYILDTYASTLVQRAAAR
jgi:hypothetical protein